MINVVSAQKKSAKITITGTVLDLEDNPVEGAIIMVDNQKTDCITDSAGNFSVKVSPEATKIGVLTFSNGYLEEEINERQHIDIRFSSIPKFKYLWSDKSSSQEASLGGRNIDPELRVNVGYAKIKVKNLTGNVGVIDARDLKFSRKYFSIKDMIIRNVSGMIMVGNDVYVASVVNFGGYVAPLVVIDGTYASEKDLDDISPVSVESVVVIKDGTAAIYGSRAYGGVIIVTTKKSLE
jgi:TonB-dependent starch-binding outer membrane protein SusC